MLKKLHINVFGFWRVDIVGMDDKACQAIPMQHVGQLTFLKIDGVIIQDVKQRIILHQHYWNFKNVADEPRQRRTAAAWLRIEMADARYRHVIGETKSAEPVRVSIE